MGVLWYSLGFGALFGLLLVPLLINLLLMVYVYKDARSRGESGGSSAIWLIFTFFFGLIAFVIWLIVRPKRVRPIEGEGIFVALGVLIVVLIILAVVWIVLMIRGAESSGYLGNCFSFSGSTLKVPTDGTLVQYNVAGYSMSFRCGSFNVVLVSSGSGSVYVSPYSGSSLRLPDGRVVSFSVKKTGNGYVYVKWVIS